MTFNERVQKMMKDHPDIFPTEAKVWSYIRGCLRRGFWEKSPMKFKFKQQGMQPPPPWYTGRGKKGAECALTGVWTMTSKLEVDHKDGHKSLLDEDDIVPYIVHLLASGDELQAVEKEAHKAKSYSERLGVSFEEALVEKKIIERMKKPKGVQDDQLRALGLPCGNDKKRKESWRKALKEEVL